ncbi:hypothetical protein L2E82_20581 [Cichorium intybus]|uniref:Uncharacterized protein n=1 Tax=Cichorium intybus TaxID=13427 RepID=A0ACB9DTH9_CICIN|nr:hypothetical protein L2E82_20581 [Cichorium intybus]
MSTLIIKSSPWNLNDFAISYPTYFHPSNGSDVFTWQNRMMKLDRKWLFCFAGAPRPGNLKSIRSLLIDQCKNSNSGKLRSTCFNLGGLYPGFFHPSSFYTQYTWHHLKNYTKYSIFIPEDNILRNISIEQRLAQIDPETIKMMRKEVTNLRKDLIDRRKNGFIEELSWKYALLEEGHLVGVHKWDPFFSKPKPNNKTCGRTTRVIGWYHSHPHITVLPSHVDVRTQAMYQLLDSGFIGLIFSCFNGDQYKIGRIQVTAFQSLDGKQNHVLRHVPVSPINKSSIIDLESSLSSTDNSLTISGSTRVESLEHDTGDSRAAVGASKWCRIREERSPSSCFANFVPS